MQSFYTLINNDVKETTHRRINYMNDTYLVAAFLLLVGLITRNKFHSTVVFRHKHTLQGIFS